MSTHAFLEAIKAGELNQVARWLDQDATLANVHTDKGLSAVLVAAYYNEPAIAQLLVHHGAELNIFEAAAVGALDRVEGWLLAQPELINAYAPDGFYPLGLAAFFGHTATVEYLLKHGADVNQAATNNMHVTPLHAATANKRTAIVELLLAHGADVNATQADGFTPLHEAAQNGQLEVVELLIEHEANVKARLASNDKTPLDLAIEYKHEEVAETLRDSGAMD